MTKQEQPVDLYNELVRANESPPRAAHLVDIHFGLTDPPPDPFAPRWDRLAEEKPTTQYRDSMDSAEPPAIQ